MSVYDHPGQRSGFEPATRLPRLTVAQIFARAAAQAFARRSQQWRRHRAIASLRRLDDRQLEDIGISRNEISRAVDRLFQHSAGTQAPLPVRPPAAPEAI